MSVCSGFTGSSPDSVFGWTRRRERGERWEPSLMTRTPPRVQRQSGGWTGRKAGEPGESEPEPDDDDIPGSIRRGVQELPPRCTALELSWEKSSFLDMETDKQFMQEQQRAVERKFAKASSLMALALAEQHNYPQLMVKCVEFIVSTPAILDAVLATDGYKHLVASCPMVLPELLKSARGISRVTIR
ncbi:hypothetical protein CFC21_099850 [Triticum aestivum]|uniref:BPM/SPOP BACK domain-containing protein n=3 Tax=Triticum TaxID=4564 RepID=A0A9R0ZNL6_TRITD|nr:hypothetical protein CFC21_099850 [Triticum aestivum]VAI80166.1 unnamed protein product [Triticum turgidum subsp. durum]